MDKIKGAGFNILGAIGLIFGGNKWKILISRVRRYVASCKNPV